MEVVFAFKAFHLPFNLDPSSSPYKRWLCSITGNKTVHKLYKIMSISFKLVSSKCDLLLHDTMRPAPKHLDPLVSGIFPFKNALGLQFRFQYNCLQNWVAAFR